MLQWYTILQSLNEINATLQKLLSGNEQQKLEKGPQLSQNLTYDYQYRTWIVFYSDIKFCKIWMKSIHPFKSYWMEMKGVTQPTSMTMPPTMITQTDDMIPMCLPCRRQKKWHIIFTIKKVTCIKICFCGEIKQHFLPCPTHSLPQLPSSP